MSTKPGGETQRVIKKGFAKKGDLIATVRRPVPGKDGRNIFGEKVPAPRVYEPKLTALRNIKVEKGYAYYMDIDGIVEVKKDEEDVFFITGRPYKRGQLSVVVAEDEMKTYLTVVPSIGGAKPVSLEEVRAECVNLGITAHIDDALINEAIERAEERQKTVEAVLIAAGVYPEHGKDGSVVYKVNLASGSRFRLMEDGSVNYKEQDLYTSVSEGALIAVVTKPEMGKKSGRTVRGKEIAVKSGRSYDLAAGNNVRVEESGDAVSYYSVIDGKLFVDGDRISVEPLMVIEEDVGLKTGNINFSGAVTIKGNVIDGYRVYAKKDITILGNIGGASVKSDGNITVLNGIIGKHTAQVAARGDIAAKFAENSSLEAGKNVFIYRAALNCRIKAGEKIIATREKGQLLGGELKASKGVEAKVIGNESEHKMEVHAGTDVAVQTKLEDVRSRIKNIEAGMKKLRLIQDKLAKAANDPERLPERLKKHYYNARKTTALYAAALERLKNVELECESKMEELLESEIVVHDTIYPGVKIYFGSHLYEPEALKTKVRIFYDRTYDKIKVDKI